MNVRHRLIAFIVWASVSIAANANVYGQFETPVKEQTSETTKPVLAGTPAVDERLKKQYELITALVEKHGYKLPKGKPLKYIKDPQNEERNELRRLMMSSVGMGKFMPGRDEDALEPFMHVLHMLPDGRVSYSTVSDGAITLGDVLEDVLRLKPFELDCASNLLFSYMPGDWVLLIEPNGSEKEFDDAGADELERVLNEQCDLGVRVEWKLIERPVITVSGTYAPKPAGGEIKDKLEAAVADGVFFVNARRAVSYQPPAMSAGFDEFIESIGYLLMMPVMIETESRPTRRLINWHESGKGIEGSDRLKPAHEQRVLDSLHEQLGYEFRVEPREVKLLSIQPIE